MGVEAPALPETSHGERPTAKSNTIKARVLSRPVLVVFLISLAVRSACAVLVTRLFGGALIQADSLMYHQMATAASTGATAHWDEYTHQLFAATATFLQPMTLLYQIFEPSQLLGALLVGVAGAATAAVTAALARDLWRSNTVALWVGLGVGLLPSQIFWSSVTMKDAFVWLMVATVALIALRASRATDGRRLLLMGALLLLAMLLLAYLRQHTLLVAGFALALTGWAGTAEHRWKRGLAGVAICIFLPWAVGLGPAGWTLISNKNISNMRLLNAVGARTAVVEVPESLENPQIVDNLFAEASNLRRNARRLERKGATEESAALEAKANEIESRANSLQQEQADPIPSEEEAGLAPSLRHLPRGTSVILLEPYPWQTSESTSLNLARAETLVWYPILALGLIGLAMTAVRLRRSELLFPAAFALGTIVVYGLTEGNVGTAYRHRGEFVWAIVLLAGAGAMHLKSRRHNSTDEG